MGRTSTHQRLVQRRGGMKSMIGVVAIVMGLVPSVLVGSAQAKVPRNFFAIDDPFQTAPRAKDLRRMHRGHVGWVHIGLEWADVEPRRGEFNWKRSDQIIGSLASRGIHVLPFVCEAPRYASAASNKPPIDSKSARKAWQGFLRAAVNRYGPGGEYWTKPDLYPAQHPDAPVVPVRRWQIWHQPNLKKNFAPVSARRYAKLVRISDNAIHRADPRAKVILAGMLAYAKPTAWRFLNRLYQQKGIKRDFDGVALHPFASNVRYQARALKRTRRVIKKHGDRRTPIWITELSWGSGSAERFGLNKGLKGQARYLKRSFRMILDNRRRWHIKRVFWFRWRDDRGCSRDPLRCTSGLFRASDEPKPAWRTFRKFSSR